MGHRQRIASQESRLQLIGHYIHDGQDPDDALTIPLPPIEVVDLRQELRAGNRSIFSRALQTALDETIGAGTNRRFCSQSAGHEQLCHLPGLRPHK
jgi:primosomal protein N' (replication factor Y) (superfamily II helicase)